MSIPTLVPEADRAPSLASRIVTIHATDVTEGAPAPDSFTFSLPCALRVPADDVILRPGGVKVRLVDGRARVRLPVYSSAVQTIDGSSDWVIKVAPSWGGSYAIRVPAGTSEISLADLPAVRPLTRREQQYAITGVGVTVTEGTQAGGTASYTNGQLDLRIQVPAFRPQTVYPYVDQTADARAKHYEREVRADLNERLREVTTAYDLAKVEGYEGTLTEWLASLRGPEGDKGDASTVPGPPNKLAMGKVTTGAAGSDASATITGTPPSQTLALTIPRGDKGNKGDASTVPGPTGKSAYQYAVDAGFEGTEQEFAEAQLPDTIGWGNVEGKPSTFPPATHSHTWASVTSKPSTFPPASHTHAQADVTGLSNTLSGKAETPGDWSQLTLLNGWAPISSGVYTYGLQVRQVPGGLQIVGIVKDGARGSIIANLPSGITPAFPFPFACEVSASNWSTAEAAACTVNMHSGSTWSIQYNAGPATVSHHLGLNIIIPL